MDDNIPPKSSAWIEIILVLVAAALLISAILIFGEMSPTDLKSRLTTLVVRGLEFNLFVLCVALFGVTKKALPQVRTFPKAQVTLVILAFSVMLSLFPRRSIIYWDEQIYMNVAQSIAATGRSTLCMECNAEFGEFASYQSEYNKQPSGFPFYLAIFFRLFGVSEAVAYFANSVALGIGTLVVGALAFQLFGKKSVAFIGAGLYGFTPMVLKWSGTSSAENLSATLCSASLLSLVLFAKKPDFWRAALLASSTAWAISIRPENILMCIPLGIYAIRKVDFFRRETLLAVVLFLVPAIGELAHLYVIRNEKWGSSSDKFSLAQFWFNLPANGGFLIDNLRYPLIFTVLAIVGLFVSESKKDALPKFNLERITFFLWFLWSWGVYLFFYAGSYNYGADVRFSLACAAPLALLAALGIERIVSVGANNASYVKVGVLAAVILSVISFFPLVRAEGFEAIDARLDANLSKELATYIPKDSIVLSHTPHLWLIRGFNSAQSLLAMTQKSKVDEHFFRRYTGGVFFHHGFWCNVPDPMQVKFCENIFKEYDVKLIAERWGRGNFRYALYQIFKKQWVPGEVK